MGKKLVYGIYEDDALFLDAIYSLKDQGFDVKDAFVPFPLHGLDDALGVTYSRLPYVAFGCGAVGTLAALSMQIWMMGIDWPNDIGGKPHIPLPSFIPVTFELTVLFASLGIVAGFLISNKLWPGKEAELIDIRQTDDRFVMVINADTSEDSLNNLKKSLQQTGAVEIKEEN